MYNKTILKYTFFPLFIVVLAFMPLWQNVISNVSFLTTLRPLYTAALDVRTKTNTACDDLDIQVINRLSSHHQLAVGSILMSLTCTDAASEVLTELTVGSDRLALAAYQRGLIAWRHGDRYRAVTLWREGKGIDQFLLIQARYYKEIDISEAQRWYEAAIMAAGSPQILAEAITAYTEETRGRIATTVFKERLAYLESYFGADTAVGHRLRGQYSLIDGSYKTAYEQLSQAIALGLADAETWYLLGDAAWKLNDLSATEQAYRAALDAPIQINWRRPWHLYRLATLLSDEGRLDEAVSYQEEGVRLSDYYVYSDNLAILYAETGRTDLAQELCANARIRANSLSIALRCETP